MTTPQNTLDQTADEDHAANLHARGYTWAQIADELAITVSLAKHYVSNAEHRAHVLATRDQLDLF